jgi:N-methylhydantoinase B
VKIDPVLLAVMRGALEQIAEEMDTALAATALSPIISDAWDRASGIYHPRTGEVIAQGTTGLPLFIAVMQASVQEILKAHPPETMRSGDVFVLNDPYCGGTHTMDVKVVKPYFHDGKLTMILANTGHWPDVGGMTPGGFSASATDVYQEGIRIPPIRIVNQGVLDKDLIELLLLNMRISRDRRGDLAAQINSLDLGAQRLDALFNRYDVAEVFRYIDELKRRSEDLMRQKISSIPDGVYHFQDSLDNDGIDFDTILIDVAMHVKGSEITFDLSGTAKACRGPFNSPLASTISGLMIGVKHVFWDVPINAGCFVPIKYIIPENCLLNPLPPHSVSGCTTETIQRLIGVVIGALGKASPDLAPAGPFGTASNICLGGESPSMGQYVSLTFWGGGYGGHALGDGLTNGSSLVSAARNASLEIIEQTVPILFTRHAVREGSAGDGEYRGGFGTEIGVQLRDGETYLTLVGDRGVIGPFGMWGGRPGATSDHEFHVGGKTFKVPHLTKVERLHLKAGDGILLRTPGGGGYGDPNKRSKEAREYDQRNGYVI